LIAKKANIETSLFYSAQTVETTPGLSVGWVRDLGGKTLFLREIGPVAQLDRAAAF
jgi:hypothetical protein